MYAQALSYGLSEFLLQLRLFALQEGCPRVPLPQAFWQGFQERENPNVWVEAPTTFYSNCKYSGPLEANWYLCGVYRKRHEQTLTDLLFNVLNAHLQKPRCLWRKKNAHLYSLAHSGETTVHRLKTPNPFPCYELQHRFICYYSF